MYVVFWDIKAVCQLPFNKCVLNLFAFLFIQFYNYQYKKYIQICAENDQQIRYPFLVLNFPFQLQNLEALLDLGRYQIFEHYR